MINYERFFLDNGLQVIVHEDPTTEIAVLNMLYNVGSRDEEESKTGFAHLFEHLMFGGSRHVEQFDNELQKVGGESNAFTNTDITNYYITLPAVNIETAFWLESDRMLSLAFDEQSLEVQRKVVIEEFKQRYLNQPYGDVWLKLRPLAYKKHPYKWPTIGKEISHIEHANMDDVAAFFNRFYVPNNAILTVAGNVAANQVKELARKWFEPIPAGNPPEKDLPVEPPQNQARSLRVENDVPLTSIHKVFHMSGRLAPDYYPTDLLSDVLGRGASSRLHDQLVKKNQLFNSINAYISGSIDPGLLVISGKLNEGVQTSEAEKRIEEIIITLQERKIEDQELQKVKNQAEASVVLSEVEPLNRAINLSYAALLGDPEMINREPEKIQAVTAEDIQSAARNILKPQNCSTLYYLPIKKK